MSHSDPTPGVEELLAERYGAELEPGYRAIDNAITRHILNHRSVRAFDETRALPPDALSTLVAAAQSASSSSNLQVWSVVAVQDPEHKASLSVAERNRRFVRQAPLFLVWLADYARAKLLTERQGVAIDGADYVESLVLASVDTALAAQNAALAAQSLGLGVVFVGGLRSHVRAIAAELKLPPGVFPVVGMAIGYPAEAPSTHIRPRLAQSAVLHHEHYDTGAQGQQTQVQAAEVYDRALDAFWKKQGIDHPLWTRHIADRLTIDPQDERWQLGDILRERGFPLLHRPPQAFE